MERCLFCDHEISRGDPIALTWLPDKQAARGSHVACPDPLNRPRLMPGTDTAPWWAALRERGDC